MPDFANPFSGNVDRKMTDRELIRALRLDLAAEEEATNVYESHADATDNQLAKKVLQDIADEERVHVGEFQKLINILLDDEEDILEEGYEEVEEMEAGASSSNWYRMAQQPQELFPPKHLDEDVDPKTGLTAAQMSVIIAKYNALSEFMAHMLGLDASDLILPGAEAKQESDAKRNARNARRLELRERIRRQKHKDWGGLIEDERGNPLSGRQQEQKEREFKERFKEYLDAGVRLVLWQSKGWDPIGNITQYSADNITDEDVEKEMQAKREQDRDKLLEVPEEDIVDTYMPTIDGVPINVTGHYPTPEVEAPLFFNAPDINDDNVEQFMRDAKSILDKANMDFKRMQQEHKMKSPEKIEAMQEIAKNLLEAKAIYEIVANGDFDAQLFRIAQGKLEDIEEALILVDYPRVLK